jgi:glycosyltransferase involved in cell wall biosynthesis
MCARIVQLADYGGPYAGSFVPTLRALVVEARERGHDTTVCFSEAARDRSWLHELEEVARVDFLAAGHGPTVARNVRRHLGHRSEATVLHTHFGRFDVAAVLAAVGRPRTVVFWHKHNMLLPEPRVRMRNTVRFAVLGRRVEGALCVTPEIRDAMVARRFPARHAQYFPNAIDLDRFSPITALERAAARDRLGLPAQARIVLHFAWDWMLKGGQLLLDATDLLAASAPDVMVATVLGEHPRPAVLAEIRRRPSMRRLQPSADVNSYYAAADLFLSTSRVEGINYAMLEALALGLPVVATVMPGQRAVLEGLPSSRAVADDPACVAAAIEELLASGPDQRAKDGAATRRALEESFSLGSWVGRALALYEHALAQTGG